MVEGALFNFHRGEISLQAQGGETEVRWKIGFRGPAPLIGPLIRWRLRSMLQDMLVKGLKPYVERMASVR